MPRQLGSPYVTPPAMPEESINLLPSDRVRALARDYYLRLAVVTLWFITALTIGATVLLVPAYLLLTSSEGGKQARLDSLWSSASSVDEAALVARLAVLSADTAILVALAKQPSVSGIIRDALLIPRGGITLSDFSYVPAEEGGALTITGVASTRNALRGYQLALQSAPFATAVNLPVSAYAKDADIDFAISVTLKP